MPASKRETLIALKATHTAYRVASDIANPLTPKLDEALHHELDRQRAIEDAGRQSRQLAAKLPGVYPNEKTRLDAAIEAAWRSGVMGPAARLSPQERAIMLVLAWIAFAGITWLFWWLAHAALAR